MPIVSALTVLPSVGLASPPDPTWIDGIYDAADFDDVIVAIAWLESRIGNTIDIEPKLGPAPDVVFASHPGMVGTTVRGVQARAPPS